MQDDRYTVLNGERVPVEEAAKPIGEQAEVTEPPKKRISLLWKIRLVVFGVAIVFGVTAGAWKEIDKYAPGLNAWLHSSVTSDSDVDYHLFKLTEAEKEFDAACSADNITMEKCRAEILAAEPALSRMKLHFAKIQEGFQHEVSQKSVPASCTGPMAEYTQAFQGYLQIEENAVSIYKQLNPSVPESVASFHAQMKTLVPLESDATDRVQTTSAQIKTACAGY
jgi:hypothetical protein